jgi:hypothetical protein
MRALQTVSMHGTMAIEPDSTNVVARLQGYVRNAPAMGMITEETAEGESETSSVSNLNP